MKNIFFIILIVFSIFDIISSKELFEDYYPEAERILENMTIFEKIGQMFIGRYDKETAIEQIETYHIGGFCLFAQNLENHTEKELIEELALVQNKSKLPLTYSVDEEGGTVVRVSKYFRNETFPSPRDSYVKGGIDEILKIEKEKIGLLSNLSFNLNFAPVADVSQNSSDYIYARTLGENASTTSEYINSVVDEYVKENYSCCLKHFPGYGNNSNTHEDVAHDYRPIDYIKANDLIPFKNAVEHDVPWIMISHNIYHSIDEEYPASISAKVHDLLRNECNFSGIATTDSLSMGAIEKYAVNSSAGVLAVKAGNDIILTSTLEKHINQVIKAYEEKEIDAETIHMHAKRVIAWKLKYIYKGGVEPDPGSDTSSDVEPVPSESSDKLLYILLGGGIGLLIIIIIILSICYYKQKKREKEAKENENEEEVDNPSDNMLVRDSRDSSTKTR